MFRIKHLLWIIVLITLISATFAATNTAEIWYSLDDADLAGSDPLDNTLNANDGTNNGATTGQTGILRQAFSFDGTNDYVNSNYIVTVGGNFSISVWIKRTAFTGDWEIITSNIDQANNNGHYLRMNDDGSIVSWFFDNGNTASDMNEIISSTGYDDGSWHHIVVTWDGTNHDLYVDGSLDEASQPYSASGTLSASHRQFLGARNQVSPERFWGGLIDEFGLYEGVTLTSGDVTELYNGGSAYNPYYVPSSTNFTINAVDSYNSTALNISVEILYNGTTYNFNGTSVDTGLTDDELLANITISSSGYDTLTFINYNISTDISNQLMNLTLGRFIFDDNVEDYLGNTISEYNVTITDLDNGSVYTCTGVSNDAICFVPKNKDYRITVGSGVFASNSINQSYTSSINISVNQIILYQFNSVRIEIYNFANDSLILNQQVNITTITSTETFTNSTTTGNITLAFLTPNSYELRFATSGFNSISKFITVINDSTQLLQVYMTENTTTELQLIEVVDQDILPIEGAVVWLQQEDLVNGGYKTIQEAETNSEGITNVWVEKDVTIYYRFAVVIDGESKPILPNENLFTTKTVFIPGITETLRLIVDNSGTTTDVTTDITSPTGTLETQGTNNETFNFTFIDGSNSIEGGRLIIYAKYLNTSMDFQEVSDQEVLGSSGEILYTMPVQNNTAYRADAYFIYNNREQLFDSIVQEFDIDVFIEKNTGLFYSAFVVAAVAATTVIFGALLSSILTVGSLIVLVLFQFISLPQSLISGLIALAIIMFIKIKRDR